MKLFLETSLGSSFTGVSQSFPRVLWKASGSFVMFHLGVFPWEASLQVLYKAPSECLTEYQELCKAPFRGATLESFSRCVILIFSLKQNKYFSCRTSFCQILSWLLLGLRKCCSKLISNTRWCMSAGLPLILFG